MSAVPLDDVDAHVIVRPIGAWNVLVTAQEGQGGRLRRMLRPLVSLEWSPFRNVALAWVPDVPALLDAVAELRERRPRLDALLGKLVPIDASFTVDLPRFREHVQDIVTPWLPRLAGGSFHVRLVRRGHKGALDSHATEQALGAWIVDTLEAAGTPVTVDFDDPDLVVLVEVVGDVAGVTLVPRALRTRHSFVRVD